VRCTAPLGKVADSTSRSAVGTVPSANSRLPLPSRTGNTHRFSRSTRSLRSSVCTRSPLPMTSTRPNSPLSRATASATSPSSSLELVHPTVSSVREVVADDLPRLLVEIGRLPAAVLESPLTVLVGRAGPLQDPVQRREHVDDQLSHDVLLDGGDLRVD